MTAALIVILAVVLVAVVVGVLAARRSRRTDTVAVFQRQIDALSPEARRPVVDQVQQLDDSGGVEAPGQPGDPRTADGQDNAPAEGDDRAP